MGQYDWLFYKYPKEETPANGLLAPVQAYFRGEFSVPGSQVYLPYRAYVKPGIISGEAHFHRDEEYLAIVGHDLRDAFESFDAEVFLYMGESPDAMEKIYAAVCGAGRAMGYVNAPTIFQRLIAACDGEIARNASDYVKLQALTEEKQALEARLEQKMDRWVYLNDLAERIEAQKG